LQIFKKRLPAEDCFGRQWCANEASSLTNFCWPQLSLNTSLLDEPPGSPPSVRNWCKIVRRHRPQLEELDEIHMQVCQDRTRQLTPCRKELSEKCEKLEPIETCLFPLIFSNKLQQHIAVPGFGSFKQIEHNVGKTIINHPFGNGLCHLFMVIWRMVYCFTRN
jgi:hypothetical protein